jgi:hypothetical protein
LGVEAGNRLDVVVHYLGAGGEDGREGLPAELQLLVPIVLCHGLAKN